MAQSYRVAWHHCTVIIRDNMCASNTYQIDFQKAQYTLFNEVLHLYNISSSVKILLCSIHVQHLWNSIKKGLSRQSRFVSNKPRIWYLKISQLWAEHIPTHHQASQLLCLHGQKWPTSLLFLFTIHMVWHKQSIAYFSDVKRKFQKSIKYATMYCQNSVDTYTYMKDCMKVIVQAMV